MRRNSKKLILGIGTVLGLTIATQAATSQTPVHPALAPNAVPIILGLAPDGSNQNRLLVTVRVCAHGTGSCADIPDVLIDTGSTGLRIQKAALDRYAPSFAATLKPIGAPGAGTLAGCTYFGSKEHGTDAWGRYYDMDVGFPSNANLLGKDVKVQVVDNDPASADRPSWTGSDGTIQRCKAGHATSNGTLGIGAQSSDCREPCTMLVDRPKYFRCEATGCSPISGDVPDRFRVHNPVLRFARPGGKGSYNGITIDLPPAPGEFVSEVPGTLSFGFDVDPAHTDASIVLLPQKGFFTAYTLKPGADPSTAVVYGNSYFDTGTQEVTFEVGNTALPVCRGGHYCPPTQANVDVSLVSASKAGAVPGTPDATNGKTSQIILKVGTWTPTSSDGCGPKRCGAVTSGALSSPHVAKVSDRSFVFGAPFFVGRRVGVLIDGQTSTASTTLTGPAYAIGSH